MPQTRHSCRSPSCHPRPHLSPLTAVISNHAAACAIALSSSSSRSEPASAFAPLLFGGASPRDPYRHRSVRAVFRETSCNASPGTAPPGLGRGSFHEGNPGRTGAIFQKIARNPRPRPSPCARPSPIVQFPTAAATRAARDTSVAPLHSEPCANFPRAICWRM